MQGLFVTFGVGVGGIGARGGVETLGAFRPRRGRARCAGRSRRHLRRVCARPTAARLRSVAAAAAGLEAIERKQRQRRPPAHALAVANAALVVLHRLARKGEHAVEEPLVFGRELVGRLPIRPVRGKACRRPGSGGYRRGGAGRNAARAGGAGPRGPCRSGRRAVRRTRA